MPNDIERMALTLRKSQYDLLKSKADKRRLTLSAYLQRVLNAHIKLRIKKERKK